MVARRPRAIKMHGGWTYTNENAYQRASAEAMLGPLVVVGTKMVKGKPKQVRARHTKMAWLMEDVLAYHTPNGGYRGEGSEIVGNMLRFMGTMRGVPDWTLIWFDGFSVKIAFIELKHADKKQEPDQILFQTRAEAMGIPYRVCHNDLEPIWLFLREIGAPMSAIGKGWGRHLASVA